jgi:hypothetical protein
MTSLRQKIKAAAEFDKELYPLHKDAGTVTMGRLIGAEDEHARLAPLIESLIDCVEALESTVEYLEPRLANKIGSRGLTVVLPNAKAALAKLHDVMEGRHE